MRVGIITGLSLAILTACTSGKATEASSKETTETIERPTFNADSAYMFVDRLVAFGPRVPNTEAHRKAGDWLAATLEGYGWEVTQQRATLPAFDGTQLQARNIFAQINPGLPDRLLLLAHWDSRPWADSDPDPAKHSQPVLGANDGASGVGVLLEIARQFSINPRTEAAVDILLVDAEDWGNYNDDESWALGTRYFAANPPVASYSPSQAILLDMVGSPDAQFGYEYFSAEANPGLLQKVWTTAARLGHSNYFHNGFGGAVTDDHTELIKQGIPAIDIIDYRHSPSHQGFDPVWHTTRDDMSNISRQTLGAVGETLMGIME